MWGYPVKKRKHRDQYIEVYFSRANQSFSSNISFQVCRHITSIFKNFEFFYIECYMSLMIIARCCSRPEVPTTDG